MGILKLLSRCTLGYEGDLKHLQVVTLRFGHSGQKRDSKINDHAKNIVAAPRESIGMIPWLTASFVERGMNPNRSADPHRDGE
jgi:hypothetical protein